MLDTLAMNERRDMNAILAAIVAAGGVVHSSNRIRCPFHEDANPSAGVYADDKAELRFKCHAGCCGFCGDVFDIRARAEGRALKDVLPVGSGRPAASNRIAAHLPPAATAKPPKPPQIFPSMKAIIDVQKHVAAHYAYTDPDDQAKVDLLIVRREPPGERKDFMACHCSAKYGGWVMKKPEGLSPIYNRRMVRDSAVVFVVEGEKCVHAMRKIDVVATTSPFGAGKASLADWSPLAGKRVYLWPDNDAIEANGIRTGIAHMQDVQGILEALSPKPEIFWIDPDGLDLPPKGDCADYIARVPPGESAATHIRHVMEDAVPQRPAREMFQSLRDTATGKRSSIAMPFVLTSRLTQALLPGSVTVLCGEPGAGKSYWIIQTAWQIHRSGTKAAVFMLEDGMDDHCKRLLAQLSRYSGVTDAEWVFHNPTAVEELALQYGPECDEFASFLTPEPAATPTYATLLGWLGDRFAEGCRVAFVDPVTAVLPSEKPWVADHEFMIAVKRLVKAFGASVVLATHPKKSGKTGAAMDDLAGGSAFSRFSHCILWLTRHDEPAESLVQDLAGDMRSVFNNRQMNIAKARHGRGAGIKLAYQFSGQSLTFEEYGILTKAK